VGNTYTASLYIGLAGLWENKVSSVCLYAPCTWASRGCGKTRLAAVAYMLWGILPRGIVP